MQTHSISSRLLLWLNTVCIDFQAEPHTGNYFTHFCFNKHPAESFVNYLMGMGDLRLHAERCNFCKDCITLTRNRHCGNEQKRLEMLLSYSIWLYTHLTACTLKEHSFFYFTEFTWSINNKYTVTGSTRQKGSKENNARVSPALHPKRLCQQGMLTFTSEAPWVPSCHCLSVITEALMWLPVPATHTMSQPNKCILCCGSAPETAAPGLGRGYKGCLTSPQTEVSWMRQLGPNQYFYCTVVSWVYLQLCLVTEPWPQKASCAVKSFLSFLLRMPPV